VLRSGTGKYLGSGPTGLPEGMASQTLKRADLYQALHEEAARRGGRIEHGKRLVDAKETGEGVRAVFADGSETTGDLLIGCDGVHSTLRRIIDPAAPSPAYSGLINTGGYAPGVPVDTEPGRYEMIFGKQAFFGYAVAPDREVWWFANIPRRGEPAVTLIEATPALMAVSPIHTIPHLPTWHSGRMIVIGDAAHAPSPTSGQGASLSIEDAVVLAQCLRDLPDHKQAFAQFETLRRSRVEQIIGPSPTTSTGTPRSARPPAPNDHPARIMTPALVPAELPDR
jgi:FAD-dependent urate hydroxylase